MNNTEETILLKRSDPSFESECKHLANDISTQKATVLDVVLKLEPYFSSKDIDDREEGMHVLSSILEFIDINSLWQHEVAQFCQFYKGRMNDHYKVIPAILNGVLALSKYDKPMRERQFTALLTAMFQTVSCQAQQYSERLKLYTILRNLLRNQTEELLDLGADFVYGVISAIDGERDPRNLIFLFEWLPEFIGTVKLGHLAEEMYEVMSCYFPVDFRVPASDANGISRDALADALKPCLCASNDFAEQTIQLVLEKLDSDLQIAKCDSLRLLLIGCKKFGVDVYVQYRTGIWSALQRELLKSPAAEVESLLLEAVTAISRKLSADAPHVVVDAFDDVLETNLGNLDAHGKSFAPTSKLLLAMSRGDRACARRILAAVQPRLIRSFDAAASDAHRTAAFAVLVEFVKVGDAHDANVADVPPFLLALLARDDDEGARALSLDALRFVARHFDAVKPVLLEHWRRLFVAVVGDDVRRTFRECVLHHAPRCKDELTTLIGALPVADDVDNFGVLMDNLSALCVAPPFADVFVNLLDAFFHARAKICLASLNKALASHGDGFLHATIAASGLVERRVLRCEHADEDDLLAAMEIAMRVVGRLALDEQAAFVARHLPNVLARFARDADAIHLVCGVVANLRRENLAEFGILERLFGMACEGRSAAAQLLANMINKLDEQAIDVRVGEFAAVLAEDVDDCDAGRRRGDVAAWLTKALFMRGHRDRLGWLQILFSYMKHADVVPNGMATIMRDDCPTFSQFGHCRRRPLYKQEFFLAACKLLDSRAGDAAVDLSFAALVRAVPPIVLQMNFEKFVRLFFSCLERVDRPGAAVPILEAIRRLMRADVALVGDHLDDLVPRLVTLARDGGAMHARIAALRCLEACVDGRFALRALAKHKAFVTDGLGRCVDDRKRLVRRAAADARLKWFLLGAPI